MTVVFCAEVEQNQQSVLEVFEARVLQKTSQYAKKYLFKAVIKTPLKSSYKRDYKIVMGSAEDMALVRAHKPRESDIFFQMSSGEKKRLMFSDTLPISK